MFESYLEREEIPSTNELKYTFNDVEIKQLLIDKYIFIPAYQNNPYNSYYKRVFYFEEMVINNNSLIKINNILYIVIIGELENIEGSIIQRIKIKNINL